MTWEDLLQLEAYEPAKQQRLTRHNHRAAGFFKTDGMRCQCLNKDRMKTSRADRFPEFQTENRFPFFRLPAELRNHVYELVLGNQTIHIGVEETRNQELKEMLKQQGRCLRPFEDYRPWMGDSTFLFSRTACVCEGTQSFAHSYKTSLRDDGADRAVILPDEAVHKECRKNLGKEHERFSGRWSCPCGLRQDRTGVVAFGLLRTCRQAYKEAALLPFTKNVFYFENNRDLERFSKFALNETQRGALRQVQLLVKSDACNIFHPMLTTLSQKTVDSLTGLRRLNLIFENYDAVWNSDSRKPKFARNGTKIEAMFDGSGKGYKRTHLRGIAWEIEQILSGVPASTFGWKSDPRPHQK